MSWILKKEDYQDFILLDVTNRKILPGKLGPEFYNFAY